MPTVLYPLESSEQQKPLFVMFISHKTFVNSNGFFYFRILCSNQTKKGGKTVVLSTQGSSTFKGNVMCIFGAKQVRILLIYVA